MYDTPTLLPTGFRDTLPPLAGQEQRVLNAILNVCDSWGYDQVKPPLAEFAAAGDRSLAAQSFQLQDPASGKMLALRPDITPQVARVAALRLKDAPRPLRLCYGGQVLRSKGEGLHAERQLAQAGAELIGETAIAADSEIVQLAIEALYAAGLKDICVDFSLPQLQAIVLGGAVSPELADAIENKDVTAIAALAGEKAPLLLPLVQLAGKASEILPKLKQARLPSAASSALESLELLLANIMKAGIACTLSIDPLERKGFDYHTGIAFSFFAKGSTEELGRGGRYSLPLTSEAAVGFSFNMSNLLRALPGVGYRETVYVSTREDATALRKQGYRVVQGLAGIVDNAAEARRLNCTHMWQANTLVKL